MQTNSQNPETQPNIVCAHCMHLKAASPCIECQAKAAPPIATLSNDEQPSICSDLGPLPAPPQSAQTLEYKRAPSLDFCSPLPHMPITVRSLGEPVLQRCLMAGDDDRCPTTGAWRTTWCGSLPGRAHSRITNYMRRQLNACYVNHKRAEYRYEDTNLRLRVWRQLDVTHVELLDFGGLEFGGDAVAGDRDWLPNLAQPLSELGVVSGSSLLPLQLAGQGSSQVTHPSDCNALAPKGEPWPVQMPHTPCADTAQIGGAA